jgi:hypothetical protein
VFSKPLSTHVNQACEKWVRVHPGGTASQFQISQLLGEASGRVASCGIAMNDFGEKRILAT